MGVFRNENAAPLLSRNTQQQGKCDRSLFPALSALNLAEAISKILRRDTIGFNEGASHPYVIAKTRPACDNFDGIILHDGR